MEKQTIKQQTLNAIDVFCAFHGVSPGYVCRKAVGDNMLYDRLKRGGDCGTEKVDMLLEWMLLYQPNRRSKSNVEQKAGSGKNRPGASGRKV